MYHFTSKQNRELMLDLEDKGITFHYTAGRAAFHVGRSWASIHDLLAKLYKCQNYSAGDRSLSIWMQGRELCMQFRTIDLEEKCIFSPSETEKIMDFLGRAPNLN